MNPNESLGPQTIAHDPSAKPRPRNGWRIFSIIYLTYSAISSLFGIATLFSAASGEDGLGLMYDGGISVVTSITVTVVVVLALISAIRRTMTRKKAIIYYTVYLISNVVILLGFLQFFGADYANNDGAGWGTLGLIVTIPPAIFSAVIMWLALFKIIQPKPLPYSLDPNAFVPQAQSSNPVPPTQTNNTPPNVG